MAPRLTAIVPRTSPLPRNPQKGIDKSLAVFAAKAQELLQEYPAWRPWKYPPKTGPHAGGRRTGDYGRGWGPSASVTKTSSSITITNKVRYAEYVGGKGQARALGARGWTTITEAGKKAAAAVKNANIKWAD